MDTKLLNQTANEWITQKENSPFISGNIQVKVRIESDTKDKIETAIEYILLHEVGHILSVQKKIVPDFREEYRNFSEFEFSKGIWKTEDVSYLDSFFPLRKEIKFYTSKPIELSKNWDSIYPTLEKLHFLLFILLQMLTIFLQTLLYPTCIQNYKRRPGTWKSFKTKKEFLG